jgi:hypothetical protein
MILKLFFAVMIVAAGVFSAQPSHSRAQTNLFPDGGFESGALNGWVTCGGVTVTAPNPGPLEARTGARALRLGNPTNGECGQPLLVPQLQARYENIRVPAGATDFSFGFWYSRVGDFGVNSTFWNMTVILVTTDGGDEIKIIETIQSDIAGGWNNARWELPPAQAARVGGRTFQLLLSVVMTLDATNDLAFYIDDIEILTTRVRTPITAQLPAALADTNTQPLLGLAFIDNKQVIVRSDLDGSDVRVVGNARAGGTVFEAQWSADGQSISYRENTLKPEPGENPSTTWAQISTLTRANPDGGNAREVYRSPGKRLVPGSPPGCRAPRTDCVRTDDPASDNVIGEHHWSADGRSFSVSECGWLRYADGYRDGNVCRIVVIDATTGAPKAEIEEALGGHWSVDNRLLYRVNLNLRNIPKGIYESAAPPAGTRLFKHKSETNAQEDVGLLWAPDGRSFVTLRFVPGNHYQPDGSAYFNSAIMLFDRLNPEQPRQLLLVDFGRSISYPSFSPDGKYLLFTLERHDNLYETRWVEVATGRTGLLVEQVVLASWRPTSGSGSPSTPVPTGQPTVPPNLTRKVRLPLVAR